MTYEQYRKIMTALETRHQAAQRKLQRDGFNGQYLAQSKETEEAIEACKQAFYAPKTVIVRAG